MIKRTQVRSILGTRRGIALGALLLVILLGAGYVAQALARQGRLTGAPAGPASTADWPMYLYDPAHSGFNRGETRLSPDNAPNLHLLWKQKLGNILAAQPVVVGDTVYAGSWDGVLYALNTADGNARWKHDLGRTTSPRCVPQTAGITSAAAVVDGTLYIGGGDNFLYALDAATGTTIWKFNTGNNSAQGGVYNWASPLVYGSHVYYGIGAFCDNPFPPGSMWGVDTTTGQADQQVHFLPPGQGGGGLWTSPTVDPATGAFYVTTGSADFYIPHAYSLARLDPHTLAVVDAWQIPSDVQVFDGDWGTTPTLFHDAGGQTLVGAAAKNGEYYAFRADHIGAGPLWTTRIADGGQCPQCGEGAISSSAFAYDTVYVAAGYAALGQFQKFAGTVHALDPATGAIRWTHPTRGPVIPAVAVTNGLVVAAGDDTVEVLNAATGTVLWDYATEATIYAAPTVAGGVLYVASTDGYLYAFGAGPYPADPSPYSVGAVGSNPPGFTPFRTPVPAARPAGAEQCFAETGRCAHGPFLQFWRDGGGAERLGPPESGELNEGGRLVQYYRNAVLELHPKADGVGSEVRIGKLDPHLDYATPHDANFDPAKAAAGATYVPETHHNLTEPFLSYWRAHGGVPALGYPVSEPFDEYNIVDGQTRQVQYFERARLEIVAAAAGQASPPQVQVGALGLLKYKQRYGRLP